MIQVSQGRRPVFIDGGLRYQSHGKTRYLREGSIEPLPGGAVSFTPIESQTDLLIMHSGCRSGCSSDRHPDTRGRTDSKPAGPP